MGCEWWAPWTWGECAIETAEDVVKVLEVWFLDIWISIISKIVGFFTDVFNAIAAGIIFFIESIEAGFRLIFDFFYSGMEWILGQFGIGAPVVMAVAVVVFLIFLVFSVRMLMWTGERLYELL